MTETAEEALQALARDLVEEIASARALELSYEGDPDGLELAVFNIRQFSRNQRIGKTGKIVRETVRPHPAQRAEGTGLEHPGASEHFVLGDPSHMINNTSAAEWKANQWKALQKTYSDIGATRETVKTVRHPQGGGPPNNWRGTDADKHLDEAQWHLHDAQESARPEGSGSPGEHVGAAYASLHKAHQIGTQEVLPRAASKEERKDAEAGLDLIQKHMEALDNVMGRGPQRTRQLLSQGREEGVAAGKRQGVLNKLTADIGETQRRVATSSTQRASLWSWSPEEDASAELAGAQRSLHGKAEPGALAEAYHHLAEAHRIGVDRALAYAKEVGASEEETRANLDRIQQHMEALDKVAGTDPKHTRTLLGSPKEQAEQATRAVERAEEEDRTVPSFMEPGRRVTDKRQPGSVQTVTGVTADTIRYRDDNGRPGQMGLSFAKTVFSPAPGEKPATGEGRLLAVREPGGGQDDIDRAIAAMPPPPKGAAAVHPQLGGHLVRLPGETVSQRAYAHVPQPLQLPAPEAPSPEAKALGEAGQRIAGYAQREAERHEADLADHLQQIHEAERKAELEATWWSSVEHGISPPGTYQPLSDEEFTLHMKQLEDHVTQALLEGQDTEHAFTTDEAHQVWNSDRAAVHSEIVREYLDKQVNVPSQRQAMLMGGMPGAGKTSVLKSHPNPLLDLKNFAAINPDDFKEELAKRGMIPELPGMSPLEGSALIHEESSHLFELALAELTRRGKNVAVDLTMKTERTTRGRVQALKDGGYNVGAVFVDIPVAVSARRTEARYRRGLEKYRQGTSPLGARHVPKYVLEASEVEPGVSAPSRTFEAMKPQFTWWEHWDNSGREAALVGKGHPELESGGIPSAEELARRATAPRQAESDVAPYSDSLGVGRGEMPQLSGFVGGKYVPSSTIVPEFVKDAESRGISVTRERVPASSLRATQTSGSKKAIQSIADDLKSGKLAAPKPLIVSSDDRVMDGHHIWAGHLLAGQGDVDVLRVGLPATQLLEQMRSFATERGIRPREVGEAANPEFGGKPYVGSTEAQARAAETGVSYFHGSPSKYKPGDLVEPGHAPVHARDEGLRAHVYSTGDLARARMFSGSTDTQEGHVYEVEPTGDVERDATDTWSPSSFQSSSPWRVLREVPEDE